MGVVHFLNVKDGDCHVIQHPLGHVSVIDVCNAYLDYETTETEGVDFSAKSLGVSGNFNQKANPENPIDYLENQGISSVFRFILTHPDMDHMDGIEDFFDEFPPTNFWDTENSKEIIDFKKKYKESDWDFYKSLRDNNGDNITKRLTLYAGARNKFFNRNEDGNGGGDGLHVLSPTPELINQANDKEDWNDSSYVILYRTGARKILFTGDSHDSTWEHILENYENDVKDIDVLMAPHHGRDSNRNYDFLDVVNPKLTLFGNAKSKHLAYDKWSNRGLKYITNNQAGTIILNPDGSDFEVYVTCKAFAEAYATQERRNTFFYDKHSAWYLMDII
ncbi:MAG: ComEC/Rec2 family competence protein [Patescibacteria group bacterium UBA2163]